MRIRKIKKKYLYKKRGINNSVKRRHTVWDNQVKNVMPPYIYAFIHINTCNFSASGDKHDSIIRLLSVGIAGAKYVCMYYILALSAHSMWLVATNWFWTGIANQQNCYCAHWVVLNVYIIIYLHHIETLFISIIKFMLWF